MRNAFASALLDAAKIDSRIILITGDLGYGVLNQFQSELPNQFLNLGIAEQSMMSIAAGLASQGYRPFVYSIANFSTLRCLEQVRNDVSYMGNPVTIVSIGAGLAYGSHGYSHHAIEDISIIRALQNVEIFSPSDPDETKLCVNEILSGSNPAYLRVGKGGEPNFGGMPFNLVSPRFIKQSKDRSAILFTGGIGTRALAAYELILQSGAETNLVSVPRLSGSQLTKFLAAEEFDFILSLEEHVLPGGFGSLILEKINELGQATRLLRLGLQSEFNHHVGSAEHLINLHGLIPEILASKFISTR